MSDSPPRGELKPRMKIVVKKGTTSIVTKKQFSIFEIQPKLKDEFIILFEKRECCWIRSFYTYCTTNRSKDL